MILVVVRLLEIELGVIRGDFEQFPVEVLPEFWGDDGMTIFGRKDDVVIAQVDAVIVMSIVARAHSLSVS